MYRIVSVSTMFDIATRVPSTSLSIQFDPPKFVVDQRSEIYLRIIYMYNTYFLHELFT